MIILHQQRLFVKSYFELYIRCNSLLCFLACSIANLLDSLALSYSRIISAVSSASLAGLLDNLGSVYLTLLGRLGIFIFGFSSKFPDAVEHAARDTIRLLAKRN